MTEVVTAREETAAPGPGRDPGAGVAGGVPFTYRTATLEGLCFRFGVRLTDARLGRWLEWVLGSLRVAGSAEHWYSLVTWPSGRADLLLDDTVVARADDVEGAVAWLLWDINRAVAAASSEHLLVHAGAVRATSGGGLEASRGVLLPGPSGAGKTTLTGALVGEGFAYLSDEVVAVTDGSTLLPYPKPFVVEGPRAALVERLSSGGRVRSGDLGPPAVGTGPPEPPDADGHLRSYLPPSAIREGAVAEACRAEVVIVPRYVPGARDALRRLGDSEALLALVTNTVNLHYHRSGGVRALAELAARCACYELVMSDLDTASRLVRGAVEE